MRHIYLLANFDEHENARTLARAVERHLGRRDDIGAHARVFVRGGRVNLEGVSSPLAREIQDWCAHQIAKARI